MTQISRKIAPKDLESTNVLGNLITWLQGGELRRIAKTDVETAIDNRVHDIVDENSVLFVNTISNPQDNTHYVCSQASIDEFNLNDNDGNTCYWIEFVSDSVNDLTYTITGIMWMNNNVPDFSQKGVKWVIAVNNGYATYAYFNLNS